MPTIQVPSEQTHYQPGESLHGVVGDWQTPAGGETESLAVRLIWFTSGKGDRDFEIIEEQMFVAATETKQAAFAFTMPHRPLSFAGTLIELSWAVEAVAFPSKDSQRYAITLAPQKSPIRLSDHSWQLKEFGMSKNWLQFGKGR